MELHSVIFIFLPCSSPSSCWICLRKKFSSNSKSDAGKREMLKHSSDVHKEQFQKDIFSEQNAFFVCCQCTTCLACFPIPPPCAFILYGMLMLKLKGSLLQILSGRSIYAETREAYNLIKFLTGHRIAFKSSSRGKPSTQPHSNWT